MYELSAWSKVMVFWIITGIATCIAIGLKYGIPEVFIGIAVWSAITCFVFMMKAIGPISYYDD